MNPVDFDRRKFLRTAGGLALVGLCSPAGAVEQVWKSAAENDGPSRIAVFFEDGFPGADHFNLDRKTLTGELGTTDASGVDFLTSAQLNNQLDPATHRLFINPYGSAFPEPAWIPILNFLSAGGNLLNLGGVPFSVAVASGVGGSWKWGDPVATYHRELGILQSYRVGVKSIVRYEDASGVSDRDSMAGYVDVAHVNELYVRFTSTRDYPGEDGSSGQRDAEVHPEVGGFDSAGDLVVAPVVRIDRLLGRFAGGKWILANFSGRLKPGAVSTFARRAFGPVMRAVVEPTFPTYYPGETPAFSMRVPDPGRLFSGRMTGTWTLDLSDSSGKGIFQRTFATGDIAEFPGGQVVLPGGHAANLAPGLYTVRATFNPEGRGASRGGMVSAENGFWIMDQELLSSATKLRVERNYFLDGENIYPVVGTSYMSEGVQRKFLFEPNPLLWERDFREMKRSGINMLRTGIWTGWKNIMLDAGRLNEAPLRALDAFVLTAAKHDIPLIFTFFAFLPESWGGENPYLDPRAVQAQSMFLSEISRRYAGAPGVIWDLINEPSFSSPDHLWQCRPNYDAHERDSWSEWFGKRHEAQGDHGVARRFRLAGGGLPGLPRLEDFSDRNIVGDFKPGLASEYRFFAQEKFREWVQIMTGVLRKDSGPDRLVTVGQDEGATADRPGPHFFADEVDFNSMHNWWYNDDLLWDSLMTSVPGKTNLIGETGVMVYETADGRPWRSEHEVRDLLEKKLAISFASGAAGFINWLWNSNPYMDSDNEAGIGLKRADGTIKPEYESVRRFARFFAGRAPLMKGREEEEAVMIIPHSNLFSNRHNATAATRTCVRAMEYHCGTALRGISEYDLYRLTRPPALMVLPSPEIFDDAAWVRIRTLVEGGSTLAISGPFEDDRYHLPTGRMEKLGLPAEAGPVDPEEFVQIDGKEYRAGYRGDKLQRVVKTRTDGGKPQAVSVIPAGKGRIVFSPVPLELSDSIDAVAAYYRFAISLSGIEGKVHSESPDPSVLVRTIVYAATLLVAFIPEAGVAREIGITLTESARRITVRVPARRPMIHFYDRRNGTLLAALEPDTDRT